MQSVASTHYGAFRNYHGTPEDKKLRSLIGAPIAFVPMAIWFNENKGRNRQLWKHDFESVQ
jgi:hypothetical protein